MTSPTNQNADNIMIGNEKSKINNVNDITDPEVNQAVISQLRRQYPDFRIAGKKIRVVSSQGDEMTDPSRLKITKITRVPLRPTSSGKRQPVSVVRHFNPEVVANNDASSEDEENRPPGTSAQSHKSLHITSSLSFVSTSPVKEGRSRLSSEWRQDQDGLGLPPTESVDLVSVSSECVDLVSLSSESVDLVSLSSDEEEAGMSERSCGECPGSNNNNNSQSRCHEDELDIEHRTSPEDPDPDQYFPLDMIKKLLNDTKVSSESFMRSCRSLDKEWFRLDDNWNAVISISALRIALGNDIAGNILASVSSSSPSDQLEDLLSLSDGEQDNERDTDIQHEMQDSSVGMDVFEDEGENIESGSIGTTGDQLPGGDEYEGVLGGGSQDDVEEDTQEDDHMISPPALYHRTQKEMLGILGLVTHVDAQGIIEERDRNVKPLVKRLRNRKPKKK